ncbi:GNAT family N-acetyltransferase [Halopiger xanaduensis]|uniref:GCN5-related N-acetyltransferase n=1 Tax=Halopiger xanaduensis (strain DSM 18323 / JCM 14033 / SH-6) TaxID=797210 RepID=F8D8W1_HALXS|nr:GNAT family N-acetyltransferase [Halopiger xanaduensis]AEH38026.1 GCN5-related N-acetyltransferase [Halopiger xanaduensis SH-6]
MGEPPSARDDSTLDIASGTASAVRVREATAGDAPTIADIHAAAIRERGSNVYDEHQLEAWLANVHPERYPIDEAGFRVLVAEVGRDDFDDRDDSDDLVGFGLLDLEPSAYGSDTGRIKSIYVRPDAARTGVGTALLDRLEAAAREAGLEQLALTASENAIEFYERQGYEGIDTRTLEMEDGVTLPALRMRKRLD